MAGRVLHVKGTLPHAQPMKETWQGLRARTRLHSYYTEAAKKFRWCFPYFPQQCLYFFPLPHGRRHYIPP